MIDIHVDLASKTIQTRGTGSLKNLLDELSIGVLAFLEGMSGNNLTVRRMLLNATIDTLERKKRFEFRKKVSINDLTK